MPQIHKRYCNNCYQYYENQGKYYCSIKCRNTCLKRRQLVSKFASTRISNKNSNWKGDKIGYNGIHTWLNKNFNFLKKQCEICGQAPLPMKNGKSRLEWALKKNCKYQRKRENFIVLCNKCHHKYDFQEKSRNIKGQFIE